MKLLSVILLTAWSFCARAQLDTLHVKNMDSIPITIRFAWFNGKKDAVVIPSYESFIFQTRNAGYKTAISVSSKRRISKFRFHEIPPGYYILQVTWDSKRKDYFMCFRPHMEGD